MSEKQRASMSERTLLERCGIAGLACVGLLMLMFFVKVLTQDPVEKARERMVSAAEWRHLRWSMGASGAELRALLANEEEARKRYFEELIKRRKKELREAKKELARAIRDDDGSPKSKRRIDEASEAVGKLQAFE